MLEAVQLSAACHEVLCVALKGLGGHQDIVRRLYERHRRAQVRQQALALQLCVATLPGWDDHITAALKLAMLCVPGGWPRPGKPRVGWREWAAGLGEGSVAQWAVAEVRRALGLRYGWVEEEDDTWRLADEWLADG